MHREEGDRRVENEDRKYRNKIQEEEKTVEIK